MNPKFWHRFVDEALAKERGLFYVGLAFFSVGILGALYLLSRTL